MGAIKDLKRGDWIQVEGANKKKVKAIVSSILNNENQYLVIVCLKPE